MGPIKPVKFIETLQKYWWLIVVCGGGLFSFIMLYANLPVRVDKVEASQQAQSKELNDLKGWAKELQGYTRAQQEFNAKQQQDWLQQTPNQPRPEVWIEEWEDGLVCCDTDGCWWWNEETGCQ